MFPSFSRTLLPTPEATICVRHGGSGPPLLLLHGHPQTHVMWHLTAPALARDYTVVCADLRGYGDSSKPPATADHETYSKRAMARDMVAVMAALGHERFAVVGHDRGGRVAYRMALDHPARVRGLAVLDIVPTGEHFRRAGMDFALGYWHWFFLAQPFDLPERVIGANPDGFYFHRGREVFESGRDGRVPALLLRPGDDPRHVRGLPGRRDLRLCPRRGRPDGGAQDRLPASRAVGREGPGRGLV